MKRWKQKAFYCMNECNMTDLKCLYSCQDELQENMDMMLGVEMSGMDDYLTKVKAKFDGN